MLLRERRKLGMSSRVELRSAEGQVLTFRQVKVERCSSHLQGWRGRDGEWASGWARIRNLS